MLRRLLIITKPPEFDSQSEVVLGQCEPFTPGWNLYLVDIAGHRHQLLSGTYADLRHVQDACVDLEDTEEIRKQVARLSKLLGASLTETIARSAPPSYEDNAITKEMPPIVLKTSPPPPPPRKN